MSERRMGAGAFGALAAGLVACGLLLLWVRQGGQGSDHASPAPAVADSEPAVREARRGSPLNGVPDAAATRGTERSSSESQARRAAPPDASGSAAARRALLAGDELRVRFEAPDGTPIPNLALRSPDGSVALTDSEGRVDLPRPSGLARWSSLERLLAFDEDRTLPLDEAEVRGDTLVLTMDDVGLYEVLAVGPEGRQVAGWLRGELRATAGGAARSAEPPGGRLTLPNRMPVLAGVTEVAHRPNAGAEWTSGPDPGTPAGPRIWTIRPPKPGLLLRGELAGLESGVEAVFSLGFEGFRKTHPVTLGPGGEFELADYGPAWKVEPSVDPLLWLWAHAPGGAGGVPLAFHARFEPGLPVGLHDLGVLHAGDVPLLAAGRVVDGEGAGVPDAAIHVMPEPVFRGEVALDELVPAFLHGPDWWSTPTSADGSFEVRGAAPVDGLVIVPSAGDLWPSGFRSVRPGERGLVLRMGVPVTRRLAWRFEDSARAAEVARLRVTRLGGDGIDQELFVEHMPQGEFTFLAVPGRYRVRIGARDGGEVWLTAETTLLAPDEAESEAEPSLTSPAAPGWGDLVVR